MKNNKKVSKIIILSIIALIFTISLVVFVLNYTKDDSSFSIIEKNWLSSHSNKMIDISVYNDVPIYGQDGEGLIFSYLDEFTNKYDVTFNKLSYLTSTSSNLHDVAFRIVDYSTPLTDNDILLFNDYYVILGKESDTVDSIEDLKGTTLGILDGDLANIRYFLNDGEDIKITTCKDITELFGLLNGKDLTYIALPNNMYLDKILENNLDVVYHINELYKKYVLTINNDNTFRNIMK